MGLREEILEVRQAALSAFESAAQSGSADAMEEARIRFIGVHGLINKLSRRMGEVPGPDKPAVGKLLNQTRTELTSAFDKAKTQAGQKAVPSGPPFDITEPLEAQRRPELGRLHPLTRTTLLLRQLLGALGFEMAEGPEVEDQRHNFDDLNIPADHPSRDAFDTFFLAGSPLLLRSQTSTVQIRVMETRPPPVRVIAPGRVYRPDKIDATHASTFHQIEGLYVDRGVSMADLKGTLQLFVQGLYGGQAKVRFRPSFFPFTEPSAEMDCFLPGLGWVEMGGCGMVDPAVFQAVNRARGDQAYDPEVWSGFAFGFGIDRLTLGRHAINDIRLFLENDLRFLRQV